MEKPSREQILSEPAGERLDAWVLWLIFGHTPAISLAGAGPDFYSTDIRAAWEVVESEKAHWFVLHYRQHAGDWYCGFFPPRPPHTQDVIAETAPLAICRAALLAVLDEA